MADTYTSSLRLRKQETNANVNVWGEYLNDYVIVPIDFAMTAEVDLNLSASNVTLSTANGSADQARAFSLNVTTTGGVARTIEIPSVEKPYLVRNNGTSTVLIKTASGTGVVVLQGTRANVYCDGAECYRTNVSGWGKLSSANFTSVTNVFSLVVTGQKFDHAEVRIIGATHTGAASNLIAAVTGAGGTAGGFNFANDKTTMRGAVRVWNYTADMGLAEANAANLSSDAAGGTGTYANQAWRMAGGLTQIRVACDGAGAFSAGTGEVWLW